MPECWEESVNLSTAIHLEAHFLLLSSPLALGFQDTALARPYSASPIILRPLPFSTHTTSGDLECLQYPTTSTVLISANPRLGYPAGLLISLSLGQQQESQNFLVQNHV